jgi:hypothetical protein
LALASAFATGCGKHSSDHPQWRINAIFDITVAQRLSAMRSREAELLSQFRDNPVGIYTLDQCTQEVFSPNSELPNDRDAILERLLKDIKPSKKWGTFPDTAWAKLADEAGRDTRPTIIIFEWNGDNDRQDEASYRRTKEAIAKLARLPHVRRVILIGVDPSQRERVRREIAPFGQERAVLKEGDIKLSKLREAIESVLQSPPPTQGTSNKGGSR